MFKYYLIIKLIIKLISSNSFHLFLTYQKPVAYLITLEAIFTQHLLNEDHSVVAIFFAETSLLAHYLVALLFTHVCALFTVVFIALTGIIFIRFNLINQSIDVNFPLFTVFHFNEFMKLHTEALCGVLEVNHIIGPALSTLVTLYTYMNPFLFVSVVQGKLPPLVTTFLLPIIFGEIFVLFGFHYLAALYTRKVHRHLQKFTSHNLERLIRRKNRLWAVDMKTHLKIYFHLSKLNEKRPYGLTYGRSAVPITMAAFGFAIIKLARFSMGTVKFWRVYKEFTN